MRLNPQIQPLHKNPGHVSCHRAGGPGWPYAHHDAPGPRLRLSRAPGVWGRGPKLLLPVEVPPHPALLHHGRAGLSCACGCERRDGPALLPVLPRGQPASPDQPGHRGPPGLPRAVPLRALSEGAGHRPVHGQLHAHVLQPHGLQQA